jgi:hypothetical protein
MDTSRRTIRSTALHTFRLAAARRAASAASQALCRYSPLGLLSIAIVIALLAGCEPPQPAKTAPTSQPGADSGSNSGPVTVPSKGTTAWGPVLPDSSPPPTPPKPPVAQPSPPTTPPAAATPQTPPTTQKKAGVGSGKKGRGYGKGAIATPAATLWATRERMVFEVQIPTAMKLFKATEDRAPKTHEEFMEKIIKDNQIHLPELPEGDRYRYDPKTEQLMVESPEKE